MTNEHQKKTTDQYRSNWAQIFDKNLNDTPEKDDSIEVDVEAENGDESVTITKTWNI